MLRLHTTFVFHRNSRSRASCDEHAATTIVIQHARTGGEGCSARAAVTARRVA